METTEKQVQTQQQTTNQNQATRHKQDQHSGCKQSQGAKEQSHNTDPCQSSSPSQQVSKIEKKPKTDRKSRNGQKGKRRRHRRYRPLGGIPPTDPFWSFGTPIEYWGQTVQRQRQHKHAGRSGPRPFFLCKQCGIKLERKAAHRHLNVICPSCGKRMALMDHSRSRNRLVDKESADKKEEE